MSRITFVTIATLGGLLVGAPEAAEAQSEGGWWEWALVETVEQAGPGAVARASQDRTLSDIIRDRIEDARRDRDRRDRQDPRTDRRDRDDGGWESTRRGGDDRRDARGRKGPPFCQNGSGHPVHGRQWCRDKGFGTYSDRIRWEDRGWEDIILGSPRRDDRRRSTMDRGGLIDVLGDVVLGRVDNERRRVGATAPLEGRWVQLRDGGRVLQIRSGAVPVAELSDVDGDGRVDVSLVPRR